MEKNDAVMVKQVDNGFVVKSCNNHENVGMVSDEKVFQSMAELRDFLDNHFDHRNPEILEDRAV